MRPTLLVLLMGCSTAVEPSAAIDVPAARTGDTGDTGVFTRAMLLTSPEGVGAAVASAGDIDADGHIEVLVGDPYADSQLGRAYLFHGSADGFDTGDVEVLQPRDDTSEELYFGAALSAAGDVDGDGFSDVIVGAPHLTSDVIPFLGGTGRAYVYYGTATGIDQARESLLTKAVEDDMARFGDAVDDAGDVDGDGYADVIIGAHHWHTLSTPGPGEAYVYFGTSTGMAANDPQLLVPSKAADDALGTEVQGVGDIDADGYDDLAVTAGALDGVYVFYGSADGVDTDREDWLEGDEKGFGEALAGADLNADGFADLAVGDYLDGAVFLYLGSSTGLQTTAAAELRPSVEVTYFGSSLSSGEDVDADGYPDLLVGAAGASDDVGTAFLHYGGASGIVDRQAHIRSHEAESGDGFADDLAMIPDINGDGHADALVAEPSDDRVHVLLGSCRSAWYPDADEDGEGDLSAVLWRCADAAPSDYITVGGDCDDDDDDINTSAEELCDGADNDCDSEIDEDDAVDASTWYRDLDGDGYGNPENTREACEEPASYVENALDCDDGDDEVNPDAEEVCGDGLDSDCDGAGGPEDDDDLDGLSNEDELELGTDGCDEDSDDDGLLDGEDDDPLVAVPADTESATDIEDADTPAEDCGCRSGSAPVALWAPLLLALARRRRPLG